MKKIFIYVSDHGFGHATRMVGLARKLLENRNISISIQNYNSYNLLKTSLPTISISKKRTDVGPIFDKNRNCDTEKTFVEISKWISGEQKWISQEYLRIQKNKPDLIISDISPMAMRLAEKIRCPSVAIGSFSWIDILERMPDHKEKKPVLRWLHESFRIPEFAIKLPLSMEMSGFSRIKRSRLLCRDLTENKSSVLKRLRIHSKPIVVYMGESDTKRLNIRHHRESIITMKKNGILVNKRFQKNIEGQNLINSSKVVIAKSGYSTMAECIKFKRIMFTVPGKDYPEDITLCREGKKFGIVKIVHLDKVIEIPDLKDFDQMQASINYKLIDRIEQLLHPAEIICEFIKK